MRIIHTLLLALLFALAVSPAVFAADAAQSGSTEQTTTADADSQNKEKKPAAAEEEEPECD